MFDSADEATRKGIFELRDVLTRPRPLVLWIGAGASKWCGLPSWQEIADECHGHFKAKETGYQEKQARQLLDGGEYPNLFSILKEKNSKRLYEYLSSSLSSRPPTALFQRFIELLKGIAPVRIVTTNVDEMLEGYFPDVRRFQRTNLEFAVRNLHGNEGFICKLHGTVSEIQNSIWSTEDYENIVNEASFTASLSELLAQSTTVFLGYGLRDQYILEMLKALDQERPLLGDGPHFLISAGKSNQNYPSSIRVLKYITAPTVDHRGAMSALSLLQSAQSQSIVKPLIARLSSDERRTSSLYLPDYFPPGTWATSTTATFENQDGTRSGRLMTGAGFVDGEMPSSITTSLHDLLVGLLCFGKIYLPIDSIGRLHLDIGADAFWILVDNDLLRLVWIPNEPAVIFPSVDEVCAGDLGNIMTMDKENPQSPAKIDEAILRQIQSIDPAIIPNAAIVERILKVVVEVPDEISQSATRKARGALLLPQLRSGLGMGDGIVPTKLPTWFAFPVLRVAQVVRDAEVCAFLQLGSAKLPFGSEHLANATYGVVASENTVGQVASYVLAGRFDANLAAVALREGSIFERILKFRETPLGIELRDRVLAALHTNDGAEFVASVNSSLREAIPFHILENARKHFVDVSLAKDAVAIWSDSSRGEESMRLWRIRSAKVLVDVCTSRGIKVYDPCPCGSGDKLKFCCGSLLQST